jgi:hypothetical protein
MVWLIFFTSQNSNFSQTVRAVPLEVSFGRWVSQAKPSMPKGELTALPVVVNSILGDTV